MASRVSLVVIDGQYDFMDNPDSKLPVAGANADMNRLAAMINRSGSKIAAIHATLDSHHVIDVGHPGMWMDEQGANPEPFTIITANHIRKGVLTPRNGHAKPAPLGGRTLRQHMLEYAEALELGGKYPLMIWPEHCLIGSKGHAIQDNLAAAFHKWERDRFANVHYLTKGVSPFTEHYGGLMAEVPLAADPSTSLNTSFLKMLAQSDVILIAGEASSHCVKSTVMQIADNIGDEHVRKCHLLTDCMSPVAAVSDTNGTVLVDFPAIAKAWQNEMAGRGMTLTTSDTF